MRLKKGSERNWIASHPWVYIPLETGTIIHSITIRVSAKKDPEMKPG
jgi:hypothetical protein